MCYRDPRFTTDPCKYEFVQYIWVIRVNHLKSCIHVWDNASTSLLSPLNGLTSFSASPTEIYSAMMSLQCSYSHAKENALFGASLTARGKMSPFRFYFPLSVAYAAVLGGWLLPLRRLAAAPRSTVLGGWLLPLILLHLAAGCCPSFRCAWWLAASPCSTALGSWLLPLVLLNLAADCFPSFCCPLFCSTWRLAAAPRSAAQHPVRMDVLRFDHPTHLTPLTCVGFQVLPERWLGMRREAVVERWCQQNN